MVSLDGDDIRKLFEKGKSNGLTVNEIIASVFSIAFMEIIQSISIVHNKKYKQKSSG
jgi:hypothetical protein